MSDQNNLQNINLEKLKIEEESISDQEFWDKLKSNVDDVKPTIEYILNEYGTKVPCNRFDVGNSIEHFFALQ